MKFIRNSSAFLEMGYLHSSVSCDSLSFISRQKGGEEMKKLLAVTMSFLLCISCLTIVSCKKAEKPAETPKPAEAPISPVQAPEVKGPDEHFQKAHEFFLKKDFKAAASEIRDGAELVKQEAEKATTKAKKALEASADELEQLAKDVEKGAVTSDKKMKDAFARAEHALAEYHYLNASELWAKKEAKETGHELESAVQHLERAAKWSGHEMKKGTAEVLDSIRTVAGKLIEGAGWVPEEVGKGITAIGSEISKLGKKIGPKKK
jgi:hypothetical protein